MKATNPLRNYDFLFRDHPTAMCIIGRKDLTIREANKAAIKLFKTTRSKLLTDSIESIIPNYTKELKSWVRRKASGGYADFGVFVLVIRLQSLLVHIQGRQIEFQGEPCCALVFNDISTSAKAEQSSQDFHQAIVNSSIVSRTDIKGTITYVNKNFIKISGYSKKELIGQNHRIINSGYHPHSFWVEMWKTITSGKIWRSEVKNRAKDGSFYWVDTFIMPLLDEHGKIIEFLSVRNDITSRKLTKEALTTANAKLSETLLFGKIGSAELDLKSYLLRVSKEMFKLLDVDSDPMDVPLEDFLKTYVTPEYLSIIQQKILMGEGDLSNSRRVVEAEFEMITATGRKIWIEGKGIFKGSTALGILQDITEKKKTVEMLKRSELKHKRLYNNLPAMYFTLDPTLTVKLVNNTGAAQLGYTPEELIGNSVLKVFPSGLHDTVTRQVEVCFKNPKQIFDWEIEKIKKDGNRILVYESAWVEHGLDNELRLNIICEDITERKRAEQEIVKQKELSHTIINSLPGVFYLFNEQGKFLRWNKNFEIVTGYSTEEISNMVPLDFFEGKDKDLIFERISKVFVDGRAEALADFCTKSKEKIPYHFNGWLIDYEGMRCLIGTGIDISIQKKAEETAMSNARMVDTMLSGITDSFFATDLNLNVVMVNPVFETLTKMKAGDMLGRNLLELFPMIENSKLVEMYKKSIASQRSMFIEHKNPVNPLQVFYVNAYPNPDGLFVYFRDISESKKAEQVKAELHNRFEKLAKHVPGFIYQFHLRNNNTYHFPYASRGIKEIYGVSPEEVVEDASKIFSIIHPDDREQLIQNIRHSARTLSKWQDEYKVNLPCGKTIWVEGHSTPEKLEDGSIMWHGYVKDISDRKKIEEKLAASENRYRSILEQFPLSVVTYNPEGLTMSGNKAWEILWQDKFENALDHNILLDHAVDATGARESVRRAFAGEVIETPTVLYDPKLMGKVGRARWVKALFFPLRNEKGKILEIISVQQDMTEVKKAEEEIRESEQRFRTMADSAPVLIWMSGTDKLCYYFNKGWLDFTGRTLEQEMGNGWAECVHHDDFDHCLEIYVTHFDRREPFKMEYRLLRADGQYRWILDHGVPRHLPNGEFIGYIGSCIDITERKNAEIELHKTTRLLVVTSQINEMVLHATDSRWVYEEACRIAVESGGFRMAWVGVIESATGIIKPVAYSGFEDNYLTAIPQVSTYDGPQGRGPTGMAARERKTIVNNDFINNSAVSVWREEALERNYKSSIALPVIMSDQVASVFTLYSSEVNFFAGSEIQLLEKIVASIGFALETIENNKKRKQAEASVIESEVLFRTLTNELNVGVLLQGLNDEILFSNLAARTMLGLTEAQLLGKSSFDPDWKVIHEDGSPFIPNDRPSVLALKTKQKVSGVPMGVYRPSTKDWVWLLTSAVPLLNREGEVKQVIVSLADISEQKALTKLVFENEARQRQILSSMNSGVIGVNTDGQITYANERAIEILSIPQKKLMDINYLTSKQPWKKLDMEGKELPPDKYPIAHALRTRQGTTNIEFGLVTDAEQVKWLSETTSPMYDSEGRFSGILVNFSDITQRIESQRLVEQQRKLIDIVSTVQAHFIENGNPSSYFNFALDNLLSFTQSAYGFIGEVIYENHVPYLKTYAITNIAWNEETRKLYEENKGVGLLFRNLKTLFGHVMTTGEPVISNDPKNDPRSGSLPHNHPPLNSFLGLPIMQGDELVGMIGLANRNGGYSRELADQLNPINNTLSSIIQALRTEQRALEISENLKETTNLLNHAYKASGLGVWQINLETNTYTGDDRILEIFGLRDKVISREAYKKLVHPEDLERKIAYEDAKILSGESDFYLEYRIIRASDGQIRHLRSQGLIFRDDTGAARHSIAVIYDLTKDKQYEESLVNSLHEKEALIKEIHHRVKNNLQLISSMLFLKMSDWNNPESREFITAIREKIKSVSLIHERLLQTESLSTIDMQEYMQKLLYDIQVTYNRQDLQLTVNTDIEKLYFSTDYATYLGQLVNELVINSMKHAFINRQSGEIRVSLKSAGNKYILMVADNGIGLPEQTDPVSSKSYGMQLVQIFVKQLKGTMKLSRERGTCFTIEFVN